MDSCLLCCAAIFDTNSTTPLLVDRSARVIFLLRKLLNLAPTVCEDLLRQHGHPAEWISLCATCDYIVTQGTCLFDQIHKLELEFDTVKEHVKKRVVSVKKGIRANYSGDADDDTATATIRRYIAPSGIGGGENDSVTRRITRRNPGERVGGGNGLHCSLKGTNSDEEIAPAETLVNVEMDGSMSVVVEGTEDQSALNASEIIENFFNPPQNPSLPKKKKTVIRRAYKKRQAIPRPTKKFTYTEDKTGYACKTCGRIMRSKNTLENHIRMRHTNPKVLTCRGCHVVHVDSRKFNLHLRDDKICRKLAFVCPDPICEYSSTQAFSTKSAYNIHAECRHWVDNAFRCEVAECGRVFSTYRKLKIHARVHQDENGWSRSTNRQ